jgi:hypothetical protein
MLSEIARSSNEKITLKKSIERLSNFLKKFEKADILLKNHVEITKKHIKKDSILIFDGSDIAKNYGKHFEDLGWVRDGSKGEIVRGYATIGVVALTEKKLPITIYENIYSHSQHDFSSENTETIKAIEYVNENFPKENIRAFDRGYDSNIIYEKLIKSDVSFIVRAKINRNVLYKGKLINISKLANKRKGKFALEFRKKNGIKTNCKISILPIKLPNFPDKQLSLVVCYGFGEKPLLLITTLVANNAKICVSVVKVYLLRWRIEEFYRLKKEQFGFENFRVRSLNSIKNLSILLNFSLSLLSIMGDNWRKSELCHVILKHSKRIYGEIAGFCLYALACGIKKISSKSNIFLGNYFTKPHHTRQISMFPLSSFSSF